MMSIEELYCDVDDFCQLFLPKWTRQRLQSGEQRRVRESGLSLSERMTIMIHFQQSQYRHFKGYYQFYVCRHLKEEFPGLVSYSRFVNLMKSMLVPLCVYLQQRRGEVTGLAFVDATSIVVCHNRRIHSHKVFRQLARRGKTSTGWFYGFKLHLIINERGELLAYRLTPANVDDRQPVPDLARELTGKLFGDKGYISKKLFESLWAEGVQLITRLRKNMKNQLMPMIDKILLRKRALIETVNDQLKNIAQIEHTRHRSVANFMVNLIAALVAYTHQPRKPSLRFSKQEVALLSGVY